ncbi:MAG TPA: haloacid dehalogenase type II [Motilibacteraceae bacterium]|nr:haloacid dehalogenase type II [Motilibacteraceae bacterium]
MPGLTRDDVDVVVFDVNETLFSLGAVRSAMEGHGLPGHLVETWFARSLRDGFALTALGEYASFPEIGANALASVARTAGQPLSSDAVSEVMAAMRELDAHPDVEPAMRMLREGGLRLVTLTNGTSSGTAALLERNGLSDLVEATLSVDDVLRWKPAPEPYLHAAARAGVPPQRVVLVAVHAWDCHGARRAGLRTGWVSRLEGERAPYFDPADLEAPTLDAWAAALVG